MEEVSSLLNDNPEGEDPGLPTIAPISEDASIIDRAVEIGSDSAPRKSARQRLGSMAARRSVRRYEAGSGERPHIGEQAVIAEMARSFIRRL